MMDIKETSSEGKKARKCFPFFIPLNKSFTFGNLIPPFPIRANNVDTK